MEFDKSKVYTALNADELEPGDVVFVADTLAELKQTHTAWTIERILDESIQYRFSLELNSELNVSPFTDMPRFELAYLIAKHDDPYKEFKKAQAEGKEVWFSDIDGNWKSNKDIGNLTFSCSPENYSLTKPVKIAPKKEGISWRDFKLGDKVEYADIEQLVTAISKRNTDCRIYLNWSGWIGDDDLKSIKRLED